MGEGHRGWPQVSSCIASLPFWGSLSPNLELAGLAKQLPTVLRDPPVSASLALGFTCYLSVVGDQVQILTLVWLLLHWLFFVSSQTSWSSVSWQRMHTMGIHCSTVHLWPSLISQSLLSLLETSMLMCGRKSLIVEWTTQHLLLSNGVSSIVGIILVGDIKDFLYQVHFLLVCFR